MSHPALPATGYLPGCHAATDVKPFLRDGVRTVGSRVRNLAVSKSGASAEDSQVVCCAASEAKVGQI